MIAKRTGATARKFVCKSCKNSCRSDVTHACDQTCSDCMGSSPCTFSYVLIPCAECNGHFRSRTFFDKGKPNIKWKRTVCERKRCCATCGWVVTHGNYECNKRFCDNYKEVRDVDNLCYMRPLKDALPSAGEKVLCAFYDFKTTQNNRYADEANLHLRNLVCVQKFCWWCEDVEDGDCVR